MKSIDVFVYIDGVLVKKNILLDMTIGNKIKSSDGVLYETEYTSEEINELWEKSTS